MNRGRILGLGLLIMLGGHPLAAKPQEPAGPLQGATAVQASAGWGAGRDE